MKCLPLPDLGRPASVQHRRPRQPPPLRGRRSGLLQDEGPAGKDDSFHPVTSLGATYVVTKNVFVNAEMFTSFARYKGTVEARGDDYVLKPMATDFTLSLGVAFFRRRTNPSGRNTR